MANIIEETENIFVLLLLCALIAIGYWVYLKIEEDPGSGLTNPENPFYGLNKKNSEGWMHYFFPSLFPDAGQDDPAWTDQDYALVNNYEPDQTALEGAVQSGPTAFQQWLQGAGNNPGGTSIGSSPLF